MVLFTLSHSLTGNLALENVSFRYNVQDPLVVRDISFEVAPGMRIALVGRTGFGQINSGTIASRPLPAKLEGGFYSMGKT